MRIERPVHYAFEWSFLEGQFVKNDQTKMSTRARADTAPGFADLHHWAIDRDSAEPIFQQLYRQARAAILARVLKPGGRLPASRGLADALGVARASVVAAYEQLLAEGYVTGRVGAGTFVAADLPDAAPRRPVIRPPPPPAKAHSAPVHNDPRAFNTGRTLLDPRTVAQWRKVGQRVLRTIGPEHLGYGDPCGTPELRAIIADYLRAARGVVCDPEQILVTAGTQHAIDIAIRVLLKPGDRVWVEDPNYPRTYDALLAANLKLCQVPVDRQGLDVAAGLRLAPDARAAFVTPSHQFPLGVVLSMNRRLALLAWARDNGSWVIEDDYASEFRYGGRPLAALQGLDEGGRVIYVGTFNKALFPGLRLGYLVMPPALQAAFAEARNLIDRQPPSLTQAMVAAMMAEGHFSQHIRRMRLAYRSQRDRLAAELERRAGLHLDVDVPDQGMHLAAYLKGGLSDLAVEQAALARGVIIRPISRLYRVAKPRQGLLLGFSGHPERSIAPAVAKLAKALEDCASL